MRFASAFDVFRASLRYSLAHSFRYLNAAWFVGLQVFGPVFFLLTSWTILQILEPSRLDWFAARTGSSDYMLFAVLGFSFQSVIMQTTWLGANAVKSEQQGGTAEAVFVTPSSKSAWLLGRIAASQLLALVSTLTVLTVGTLAFPFTLSAPPDFPSAFVGVFLTLLGTAAFAFTLAGLTLLVKRTEEISQVLWTSIVFFSGLAFPVEALPGWAQIISWVFPVTHGLAITRTAIMRGYNIFDPVMAWPLSSLLLLTAIYLPLGYLAFKLFFDRARRKGALATY